MILYMNQTMSVLLLRIHIMKKQKEAQNDLLRAIQNREKTENIDNKIEILNDTFLAANDMYRYFDIKTALEAGIMIGIEAGKSKNNELLSKIDKLTKSISKEVILQ